MAERDRGPRLPPQKSAKGVKKSRTAAEEAGAFAQIYLRGGLSGISSSAYRDPSHFNPKATHAEVSTEPLQAGLLVSKPSTAEDQSFYGPNRVPAAQSASPSPEPCAPFGHSIGAAEAGEPASTLSASRQTRPRPSEAAQRSLLAALKSPNSQTQAILNTTVRAAHPQNPMFRTHYTALSSDNGTNNPNLDRVHLSRALLAEVRRSYPLLGPSSVPFRGPPPYSRIGEPGLGEPRRTLRGIPELQGRPALQSYPTSRRGPTPRGGAAASHAARMPPGVKHDPNKRSGTTPNLMERQALQCSGGAATHIVRQARHSSQGTLNRELSGDLGKKATFLSNEERPAGIAGATARQFRQRSAGGAGAVETTDTERTITQVGTSRPSRPYSEMFKRVILTSNFSHVSNKVSLPQ
jgi:hypothetical protein